MSIFGHRWLTCSSSEVFGGVIEAMDLNLLCLNPLSYCSFVCGFDYGFYSSLVRWRLFSFLTDLRGGNSAKGASCFFLGVCAGGFGILRPFIEPYSVVINNFR